MRQSNEKGRGAREIEEQEIQRTKRDGGARERRGWERKRREREKGVNETEE